MIWPRRKKSRISLVKQTASSESKEATRDSGNRLRETQAEWPEINRLTNSLKARRERNHFAEMIRRTVLGEER